MSKQILKSDVQIPAHPRVRFFKRVEGGAPGKAAVQDVTCQVARIVIEDQETGADTFAVLRFNATGDLVWKTIHLSLDEAKWHSEFEYGVAETAWQPVK